MDTRVGTAPRPSVCLLADDGPSTLLVDAKTHGRQVWERLSLDQPLWSSSHLPGTVLGAGATGTGKQAATLALGRCRRAAVSGPAGSAPGQGRCGGLYEERPGQTGPLQ